MDVAFGPNGMTAVAVLNRRDVEALRFWTMVR